MKNALQNMTVQTYPVKFFALALTLAALAAATIWLPSAHAESLGFSLEASEGPDLQVSVLDDLTHEPLTDAQVGVGALSARQTSRTRAWINPFSASSYDQVDWTRSDGSVLLKNFVDGPKVLTVAKTGYSVLTLAGIQSNKVTVYLKRLKTAFPDVIANGTVGGWSGGPEIEAKPISLGLVIRSLSGFDLLNFSLESVVSPLYDTINIWGDRQIPSNLVMPPQTIPILFGSAKVNKLNYRLPVPSLIPTRLGVIQGKMNSDDLIDIGQSGELKLSSLNKLEFTRVGLSDVVVPTGNFQKDMNAESALSATHSVTVTSPGFTADVLVAAFTNMYGDRSVMVPTDLKTPISASRNFRFQAPTTVSLKSMAQTQGAVREVLGIAISPDNKKLSGMIAENAGAQVQLGGYLPVPTLADSAQLPALVNLPAAKQGISAAVFEMVKPKGTPANPGPSTYAVWTVYSLPAAGSLSVSTQSLGTDAAAIKSLSLVSMEFAPTFEETRIDGLNAILDLRRFSRATAKIGR